MSARTGQSPPAPPLHPPALPVQILRDRFGAWNRDRSATKRKEGKEAGDGGGEETVEEGRGKGKDGGGGRHPPGGKRNEGRRERLSLWLVAASVSGLAFCDPLSRPIYREN